MQSMEWTVCVGSVLFCAARRRGVWGEILIQQAEQGNRWVRLRAKWGCREWDKVQAAGVAALHELDSKGGSCPWCNIKARRV